ncbi:ABC transporter substrate-binding protein [Thalassobaculum sp. OXR-137]|uniref:ABC transporter substrate-binding protein n=1 Tax=Thalassobaculum sp. OXR-137 TaxID=3100173 RepID=UPI002AC92FAD|nr:ABC transporter substrate-binding protein [Thalassobaculum sp. OXR-137]WPZ32390.1 ABC transporter substrate-binding protein [Thalassobaculum sp. OXR-137]
MTRPAIKLFENLRTIGYVPFYLAVDRGEWAREGVDVAVTLSPSTDYTAQGLLDGATDVSWGGPMRVMMHHDSARKRGEDCPLVCFGQVVARDPFALVGREPNERFRYTDLKGLRVAVATEVPTPWMTFQDDLDRAGVALSDWTRAPDRTMAENVEALGRGEVDVILVFEPYADRAVTEHGGHVWHRFATRGDVGFTSFYTTRGFAERERETCRALVRGIGRSLRYLHAADPAEMAATVQPYFPELSAQALTRIIGTLRGAGLWARTPQFPPTAFVRLKSALLTGGLISHDIPYDLAVDADLSDTPIPTD